MYDRMLRTLPETPIDQRIRIVTIDDRAIETVGEWPWSRQLIAEGLAVLAEFNPTAVLMDIEFSEPSPLLIEQERVQRSLEEYTDLIPRSEVEDLLFDRDVFLAETIAALGMVYVPATVPAESRQSFRPALEIIRDAAAGEGFVNRIVDPDGVMRRSELFRQQDGKRFPQVGISHYEPVLQDPDTLTFDEDGRLQNREVTVSTADGDTFTVPLTPEGHMLLRWPRRPFDQSFQQISWTTLIEYQQAMADLEYNLRLMDEAGYLDSRFRAVLQTAQAVADTRAEARTSGNTRLIGEYRRLRQAFIALTGGFLQGGAEQNILDELEQTAGGDAPEAITQQIAAITDDVRFLFGATREIYREVEQLRSFLDRELSNSLSLIGYTATSTADMGVTPFDASFSNVGLHAVTASMFSNQDFIRTGGWVLPWLLGIVWMTGLALVLRRTSGQLSLFLALAGMVFPLLAATGVFRFLHFYIPVLSVSLPVIVVALALLVFKYLHALRDRQLIHATFEHYLAPEVIKQLIADPSRIGVTGQEKELTALFTDVANFSRTSEILGTADVVTLLNEYLTEMSDVILDYRGTIDKYEGDAIMAFFGAPISSETHAEEACRVAIQMKKVETLLNDRLVRSGAAPRPLVTRIGINTGPMIVGNLGTIRRLNYTVMGPAVNLASRLEGANKIYGTRICVSEAVFREVPEGFLMRRMDRVRVQGIDNPVRLYELLGYAEEASAPLREALELFSRGLAAFEKREWPEALNRFETVLRIYPDDGPSLLFIKRCKQLIAEPPRDTWDGILRLPSK